MSQENQAHLLVALQDLEEMIREAEDPRSRAQLEEMGFPVQGIDRLREEQQKLEKRIQPGLLKRYRQLANRSGKAVVPVVDKFCPGCFTAVPASFTSSVNANKVIACETCGRILYWP